MPTTMMSQFVKNGQTFGARVGTSPIAIGDLLISGGPGGKAWSAAFADYAAVAGASTIVAEAAFNPGGAPSFGWRGATRDSLGNVYAAIVPINYVGLSIVKLSPGGVILATSTPIELSETSPAISPPYILVQLSNGYLALIYYVFSSSSVKVAIFDAALNIVSGPTLIAAGVTTPGLGQETTWDITPLSGGGFAVAYMAGASLNFAVYSNTGSIVVTPTNIQTLVGAPGTAGISVRLVQLSNGNVVCAIFAGTVTAGGNAGTNFVIVQTSGAHVAGPTNLTTATGDGSDIEISAMPSGGFAISVLTGANLVAGVYNNAGALQGGSAYSVGTTRLVNGPLFRLLNDAQQYWIVWQSSNISTGLYVIPLSTAGVPGQSVHLADPFTINGFDAQIINGLIVILFDDVTAAAPNNGFSTMRWMTVGLPDPSLGLSVAYQRHAPTQFGTSISGAGQRQPTVLSAGGSSFFTGAGAINPPSASPVNGDFTAAFLYNTTLGVQATSAFGVQKVETSAIIGVALTSVAANSPSAQVNVNAGPGSYLINNISGTPGTLFAHNATIPGGLNGRIYNNGVVIVS